MGLPQKEAGLRLSEEEEINREVGVAEEEKEVIPAELVLTGTTVHIKTESTKAKELSGYETGEKNIQPGAEPYGSQSQDRGERVQVQGKRRIWGTLKACSSIAAMQTISQLTGNSKEKLQIKRKFKRLHDNKTRWWHIVSGDEGDLDKLEGEWEAVKLQTGWKLEKCFVDGNFLRNGDSPPT